MRIRNGWAASQTDRRQSLSRSDSSSQDHMGQTDDHIDVSGVKMKLLTDRISQFTVRPAQNDPCRSPGPSEDVVSSTKRPQIKLKALKPCWEAAAVTTNSAIDFSPASLSTTEHQSPEPEQEAAWLYGGSTWTSACCSASVCLTHWRALKRKRHLPLRSKSFCDEDQLHRNLRR